MKKKSNKKQLTIALIIIVCISALVICFMYKSLWSASAKVEKKLSIGEQFLADLDYDEALECYLEAIKIDKKCVDAYLGASEAYMAMGRMDEALEVLKIGYNETQNAKIQEQISIIDANEDKRQSIEIAENGESNSATSIDQEQAGTEEKTFDVEELFNYALINNKSLANYSHSELLEFGKTFCDTQSGDGFVKEDENGNAILRVYSSPQYEDAIVEDSKIYIEIFTYESGDISKKIKFNDSPWIDEMGNSSDFADCCDSVLGNDISEVLSQIDKELSINDIEDYGYVEYNDGIIYGGSEYVGIELFEQEGLHILLEYKDHIIYSVEYLFKVNDDFENDEFFIEE